MLGDIGQRFLRDAVKRRLGLGREAFVEQPRGMQLRGDPCATRPGVDVARQRCLQTEVVERGRSKLPDQVIDVSIELVSDQVERFNGFAQVGSVRARALE